MKTYDAAWSMQGCRVIALRRAHELRALRRSVERAGGELLCLPLLAIRCRSEPALIADLELALQAPRCLFSSPNAVRCAARLADLAGYRGIAIAIGAGSARALQRAGVAHVVYPPEAMRSEGVLALPELAEAGTVGLVSAPGGRDALAPTLRARGFVLHRADVYRREVRALSTRQYSRLASLRPPLGLLLSSAEAFAPLAAAAAHGLGNLHSARVVAASERLALLARECGFHDVVIAAAALPQDLFAALLVDAKPATFR